MHAIKGDFFSTFGTGFYDFGIVIGGRVGANWLGDYWRTYLNIQEKKVKNWKNEYQGTPSEPIEGSDDHLFAFALPYEYKYMNDFLIINEQPYFDNPYLTYQPLSVPCMNAAEFRRKIWFVDNQNGDKLAETLTPPLSYVRRGNYKKILVTCCIPNTNNLCSRLWEQIAQEEINIREFHLIALDDTFLEHHENLVTPL
jgi:hypothetical protein